MDELALIIKAINHSIERGIYAKWHDSRGVLWHLHGIMGFILIKNNKILISDNWNGRKDKEIDIHEPESLQKVGERIAEIKKAWLKRRKEERIKWRKTTRKWHDKPDKEQKSRQRQAIKSRILTHPPK